MEAPLTLPKERYPLGPSQKRYRKKQGILAEKGVPKEKKSKKVSTVGLSGDTPVKINVFSNDSGTYTLENVKDRLAPLFEKSKKCLQEKLFQSKELEKNIVDTFNETEMKKYENIKVQRLKANQMTLQRLEDKLKVPSNKLKKDWKKALKQFRDGNKLVEKLDALINDNGPELYKKLRNNENDPTLLQERSEFLKNVNEASAKLEAWNVKACAESFPFSLKEEEKRNNAMIEEFDRASKIIGNNLEISKTREQVQKELKERQAEEIKSKALEKFQKEYEKENPFEFKTGIELQELLDKRDLKQEALSEAAFQNMRIDNGDRLLF